MRKVKQLFICALISITLSACTKKENVIWNEGSMVLSGKVLNFNHHKDHKTIQFIFRDLFDLQKKTIATINEDGTFNVNVLLHYPQDFSLNYGNLATLFSSPGDSLHIEVDADIWNNQKDKKPNGNFFVQIKGGTAKKTNQDIIQFIEDLPNEKYIDVHFQNAVKSKSPEEFTVFILQRERDYRNFLKSFNKANKTNKTFQRWADNRLRYGSWNDLMRYAWLHPSNNQIPRDSFQLPNTYYTFLKKYDMNDKDIISATHADFLHEFSMYAQKNPKDSLDKVKRAFKKEDVIAGAEILKNMIKYNSSGFTQQLLFTKFYLDAIRGHQIKEFEVLYDSTTIINPYFKVLLSSELENAKDYLANKNTLGANLSNIEGDIISELIKNITTKYKGKVIYMDFWGPWCAPCMKEMPHSKKMQEYFKDKDVVFLFLAVKTNEHSWKATISNKNLTGEHVNLTEDQVNVLTPVFGIVGYPHYALIDKKGNIAMVSAPNPSDKEHLKIVIENLLKE